MIRIVWCVVLVAACWGEAVGQQEAQTLTVDECVRQALAGNRLVLAAREEAESARQSSKETGTQRLPRVTTSASYARINDSGDGGATTATGLTGATGSFGLYGGVEEYSTASVSVVGPIADQIGLRHTVSIARLEAEIAALEQASAENAAAFAARRAYYTVLTYEKTGESVRQTIAELESTLKLTRSLKDAGRVLQRDVNKADIALEQARLGLLRAANALQAARSSLRDVLGLKLDAAVAPAATEAIEAFELDAEACILTAYVERPDLRASTLRHEAARRGVALARSAYVPSVGASVSYEWQDTDLAASEDSVVVGLNWSWDVWDWGGRRSAVRSARASARSASFALEDERSRVALEVERLWLGLEVARRRIDVAKKEWDYAIENVRVSREKYEAGTLLITDLLDDQTALNDSRIAYYVAIYDYAIALADLRRAMGRR